MNKPELLEILIQANVLTVEECIEVMNRDTPEWKTHVDNREGDMKVPADLLLYISELESELFKVRMLLKRTQKHVPETEVSLQEKIAIEVGELNPEPYPKEISKRKRETRCK